MAIAPVSPRPHSKNYRFPSEQTAAIVVMRLRQHFIDARILPSERGDTAIVVSVDTDCADVDDLVAHLDPSATTTPTADGESSVPTNLERFLLARIAEDEDGATIALSDRDSWVWSAERVLAECATKRRIIAEHQPSKPPGPRSYCTTCDGTSHTWPCTTLQALALPYASHPHYQRNWHI